MYNYVYTRLFFEILLYDAPERIFVTKIFIFF